MRKGKSLVELATELERQTTTKRDFLAPTAKLRVAPSEGGLALKGIKDESFPVGKVAHEHLSQNLKIPSPYYNRMLAEAPDLLADNVNRWLRDEPERRLVRTLDGRVRAFVSDRYRPMDNHALAEAVLPVLQHLKLEIMSSELTDRRLYIKAVSKDIVKDMPKTWDGRWGKGHEIVDTLSPAIVISNSEVRCGGLNVQTSIFTKLCTNLSVFAERSMRKYHLGGRLSADDETYGLLSDATKALDDRALWSKVRDVVRNAFNRAEFDKLATKIEAAGHDTLPKEAKVEEAVELVGKKFGLTDGERGGVLKALIEGGDLTRYGFHAAVTRYSQEVEDYDRASELEAAGGQIIELSSGAWKSTVALAV